MYGYVVFIRYKIRAKHGDMPHVTLTKRAIRLAGTFLWHTNPIEKGIVQATKLLADVDKRCAVSPQSLTVCPAQAWH